MGVTLDQKRQLLIVDDGREIPIPDDIYKSFMRKAGRSEKFMKRKGKYKERELKMGHAGTSAEGIGALQASMDQSSWLSGAAEKSVDAFTAAGQAFLTGEGQEDMSYYQKLGEMYQSSQQGTREGRQELIEKHPYMSMAGTVAGMGQDIVTGGGGLKGAAIAPLMGAGVDPTNIFEEPGKWAMGRGIESVAGYGIDKIVGGLGKIAKQRAARKALPEAQRKAKAANDLAEEAFNKAKAATEEAKKLLPAKQIQARRIHGNAIREQTSRLGREVSVTEIPREAIKVNTFVNDSINASQIAGTPEGKRLTSFFTSVVESRPEKMGWKDISTVINAVEDRIIVATEEELPFLLQFKEHMLKVVPQAVGEASAQRKYAKRVVGAINKLVDKEVNVLLKNKAVQNHIVETVGKNGGETFKVGIKNEVKRIFNGMSPSEFNYAVNSGEAGAVIEKAINNSPIIQSITEGMGKSTSTRTVLGSKTSDPGTLRKVNAALSEQGKVSGKEFGEFASSLSEKVPASLEQFAGDLYIEAEHVAGKTARRLSKTLGAAEQLPVPLDPIKQAKMAIPEKEAMGFLGALAERPIKDMMPKMGNRQGMGALAGGAIGSAVGVAALPTTAAVVGGGAAVAGAGLGALKMATAPGKLGDITRKGISFFGKRFPLYLEAKYESYEDGVLTSPEDRLNASIEIEKDPYLSNEKKAIWQTKINKGQRIR